MELASEGVGCPGQECGTVLKAVGLMMEVNAGNDLEIGLGDQEGLGSDIKEEAISEDSRLGNRALTWMSLKEMEKFRQGVKKCV